jgi:hypothetical protein
MSVIQSSRRNYCLLCTTNEHGAHRIVSNEGKFFHLLCFSQSYVPPENNFHSEWYKKSEVTYKRLIRPTSVRGTRDLRVAKCICAVG